MNGKNNKPLLKSIIVLSVITVLGTLALVGCSQSSPSNLTETSSPNSSMSHGSGTMMGWHLNP